MGHKQTCSQIARPRHLRQPLSSKLLTLQWAHLSLKLKAARDIRELVPLLRVAVRGLKKRYLL